MLLNWVRSHHSHLLLNFLNISLSRNSCGGFLYVALRKRHRVSMFQKYVAKLIIDYILIENLVKLIMINLLVLTKHSIRLTHVILVLE